MKIKSYILLINLALLGAVQAHAQLVTSYAGNGVTGYIDDTGLAASFNWPINLAMDAQKNIYVTDADNNMVRKISASKSVTTFAGSGTVGITNDTGIKARLNHPLGLAIDKAGNLYVGDSKNNMIRKITPGGVVSLYAGSGLLGSANGPDSTATFNYPNGIAVDDSGYVYVADASNNMIRKISPRGTVSTLAGSGVIGLADGTGSAAMFDYPTGIAIDSNRNLYVTDETNHLIRKVTQAGVVTTYAGTGTAGNVDDTGIAASFAQPYGISIDAAQNLYVAEIGSDVIRMITPTKQVMTLAGTAGVTGLADGIKFDAEFNNPTGVIPDGTGNLYVADWNNNMIRKVVLGYTSVFSVNKLGRVAIYPNPVHDELNVPTHIGDRVVIYNVAGVKVYDATTAQLNTVIATGKFASGAYFVSLIAKNGDKGYAKFVKE